MAFACLQEITVLEVNVTRWWCFHGHYVTDIERLAEPAERTFADTDSWNPGVGESTRCSDIDAP